MQATSTSMDAPATSGRRTAAQTRQLFTEGCRSPVGVGLAAAVLTGLLVTLFGLPASSALAFATVVGVIVALMGFATYRLAREVRNAADSATIAALLGEHTPALGTWAAEADFAQLVALETRRGCESIVECGSGATTLVIATCLRARGCGKLVSIEHDPAFAQETRRRLEAADLADWVDVVEAPLRSSNFGSSNQLWYDTQVLGAHLPDRIDLLIVDGPPAVSPWARWPAVEHFLGALTSGAVVLLDDGRRPAERRAAFRWQAEHPELELYWHDTLKGTWRLVKGTGTATGSPLQRTARRALRVIDPKPVGFGRWPVSR